MSACPTPDPITDHPDAILPPMLCAGAAMQRVAEIILKIRHEDVPVLITGETGVGKDLVAQAIHRLGHRCERDFAVLNCSSLSREVLESQLFGHRKGSFTGATSDYSGIIRSAAGGSLFLDEIGDLEPSIQPKLLRFLQSGEVLPLGEPRARKVNVRLIAATNKDLQEEIRLGNFRSDLYYRINTICIHIPPLRHRRDEIPHLINHYLQYYMELSGKHEIGISQETVGILMAYDWPGNIRQLCSELRRIIIFSDSGDLITPDSLSPEIIFSQGGLHIGSNLIPQLDTLLQEQGLSLSDAVGYFERALISRALELHAGSISPTARLLGLTRRGFKLKMKRFNISTARRSEC